MTTLDSLILGTVQGITEFLPVSSTGHLILMREVLGVTTDSGLAVDATFHFATAFAVLLYFRKDILDILKGIFGLVRGIPLEKDVRILLVALAVGTLPGVFAGLLLEDTMDTVFRNTHLVAWVLILTSLLFVLAEQMTKRYTEHKTLTVKTGFLVGLFQALALLPGTSRSGATISGGMLLGLSRETAARFAFLLSFPIILGGGLKKLFELSDTGMTQGEWGIIALGALAAFISGIACIHYLLKFLKHHTLYVFVAYRIALAFLVLAFV